MYFNGTFDTVKNKHKMSFKYEYCIGLYFSSYIKKKKKSKKKSVLI